MVGVRGEKMAPSIDVSRALVLVCPVLHNIASSALMTLDYFKWHSYVSMRALHYMPSAVNDCTLSRPLFSVCFLSFGITVHRVFDALTAPIII